MTRPIDQWGPRTCPTCGAPPFVYCHAVSSGRKSANPHPARWPERERRVYGKEKLRQTERRISKLEKEAAEARRTLPLSLALADIERTQMAVFRERTGQD